ncbi:MAG: hypothetical protein KGK07_16225 [Chloroflexota bacterium]|nr:hypothetical protein [Chloroflexota bacterium]
MTDPLLLTGKRRIEICSTGIDEALQGLGADPLAGLSWAGLRVPAWVPYDPQHRMLFALASYTVPDGGLARLVGIRQGWTMGVAQIIAREKYRVVEQWVDDPFFKLTDGNISWHLRYEPQRQPQVGAGFGVIQPPMQNFAFDSSDTPALLYWDAAFAPGSAYYIQLADYTPPNAGQPRGTPLCGDLGTFYDLKTKWRDAHAWHNVDAPLIGPGKITLYASVQQSDPVARPALTAPGIANFYSQGLSAEEQFLLNFPTAIIWRVAGALAIELISDGGGK